MLIIPKIVSDEITRNIMKALEQHPEGLMIKDVSKLTKRNRITTSNYLDILFAKNLIHMRNIGTAKLYYIKKEEVK